MDTWCQFVDLNCNTAQRLQPAGEMYVTVAALPVTSVLSSLEREHMIYCIIIILTNNNNSIAHHRLKLKNQL